jgi:hypothetical protein
MSSVTGVPRRTGRKATSSISTETRTTIAVVARIIGTTPQSRV